MRAYAAGEDLTLILPFATNGEPFVPDTGSVEWELRGHAGQVVSPKVTLPGATDTEAEVIIPAADNILAAGAVREKRTVLVTGRREGFPFSLRVQYQLTGFLNMTVDADDVRTFIGIDANTLPDDEIDLVGAFFDVAAVMGYATLDTSLGSSVAAVETSANRAILAQAVLNLIPGLPARISKSESDGTTSIERFPVDIPGLEARASELLTSALRTVTPPPVAVDRTLIVVTPRADPLTGA